MPSIWRRKSSCKVPKARTNLSRLMNVKRQCDWCEASGREK